MYIIWTDTKTTLRTIDGRKTTKCQLIVFIRFFVRCVFATQPLRDDKVVGVQRQKMFLLAFPCTMSGEGVRVCVYELIFLFMYRVSIACQVSLLFNLTMHV